MELFIFQQRSNMYNSNNVYECIFVKRLNRFVATVILEGEEIDVHINNTGRCLELLIPGSKGYLVKSENANRKYQYDLVAIYKGDELVNFDSQLPNAVVSEYIKSGKLFSNVTTVLREMKFKNSRFDIYVERTDDNGQFEKLFVEVKGVTLYDNQVASFPDAQTTRGTKHLQELVDSIEDGYKPYVFFLVQTENVTQFKPNATIDPKFAQALKAAVDAGVEIMCYNSIVTKTEVIIKDKLEVLI